MEISLMSKGVIAWVTAFIAVFVWSVIAPKDLFTWFLEVVPAIVGFVLLAWTRRSFPLTPLLSFFLLMHCWILMIGGHYTYAEVPLFDWLRDVFGWSRNHYDKVGHFAQGFVPALLAREILIRREIVSGAAWRFYLIVCICLSFSAFYELIEWRVSVVTGEGAEAFLGTQGDVWDTQSDMAWALFGSIVSQVLLGRWHDRQIARLQK